MARPEGIDVSNNQGSIDWPAVGAALPAGSFVWLKVSEGKTFVDAFYKRNAAGARKAGLVVGGYHYARPTNVPEDEARHFLGLLECKPGDLAPALDLEVDDGVTPPVLRRFALAWLRAVREALGVRPFFYTYPFFAQSQGLAQAPALAGYPLWIANYGVSSPTIPLPWRSAVAWQYTSSGRVPGVAGRVDRNRWLAAPDPYCGHRL